MKKAISVLLLACMLLTLTACGSQPAAPATDPTAEPAAEATEAPAAETAEAEYKLGMGVSVSLDSSDTNKAQVDATVATAEISRPIIIGQPPRIISERTVLREVWRASTRFPAISAPKIGTCSRPYS